VHYDIDFLKPIFGGDWVRFYGEIVKIGNTSRTFDFTVERYIDGSNAVWDDSPDPKYSIVKVMDQPELVLKGQCVTVVPKPRQRGELPTIG
jgi:3-aminobutyryl-CoA ammonia-lyase